MSLIGTEIIAVQIAQIAQIVQIQKEQLELAQSHRDIRSESLALPVTRYTVDGKHTCSVNMRMGMHCSFLGYRMAGQIPGCIYCGTDLHEYPRSDYLQPSEKCPLANPDRSISSETT